MSDERIEQKIFDALLVCFAMGEKVSAYKLANYAGLSRTALAYHIKKKKNQLK